MKADAVPLLEIFEKKMRLEVPLFQRQYVWSKEQQWEPLWEDISRKFAEYLEGRKDAPVHFLGAMVFGPEANADDARRETPSDRWTAAPHNATDFHLGMSAAPLRAQVLFQASASRSLVEGQARQPRLIMNRSEAVELSGLL